MFQSVLPERRLVKGSELAAVQAIACLTQQIAGLYSDLKMCGNRFFVKTVGLARQFDFAVQRLIRHTEQRSIRHPEAVALRSDRCGLHVYGDGTALGKSQRRGRVAQLPIAVVGCHHRTGTHPSLQICAARSRYMLGGNG